MWFYNQLCGWASINVPHWRRVFFEVFSLNICQNLKQNWTWMVLTLRNVRKKLKSTQEQFISSGKHKNTNFVPHWRFPFLVSILSFLSLRQQIWPSLSSFWVRKLSETFPNTSRHSSGNLGPKSQNVPHWRFQIDAFISLSL